MSNRKVSYLTKNVWTVPNFMSFFRILLVPVFIVLFLKGFDEPSYTGWSILCLAVSGLTDLFDGKIARRFNQVSELGKILDPIADKLTLTAICILLFIRFFKAETPSIHAFAWVFLLFIVKDLVMLIGGALMIGFGLRPGAAEIYGKAATFTFYVVMGLVIGFGPEIGWLKSWFTLPEWLMMALVILSVVMTFVAFASYMPDCHRQVQARFSPEGKKKAREEKLKKQQEKSNAEKDN